MTGLWAVFSLPELFLDFLNLALDLAPHGDFDVQIGNSGKSGPESLAETPRMGRYSKFPVLGDLAMASGRLFFYPLVLFKNDPSQNRPGWEVLRILLGLVLLAAAAFKSLDYFSNPFFLQPSLLFGRWASVLLIDGEIILALWALLGGPGQKKLWWFLTIAFGCFGLFSLGQFLQGENSCGCFGKVTINPGYTALFDLLALMALANFRPAPRKQIHFQWGWCRLVVFWGTGTLAVVGTFSMAIIRAGEKDFSSTGVLVLSPQTWTGKIFPLLPFVETTEDFQTGEWLIILINPDCPKCQELLLRFENLSKKSAHFAVI